MPLDNEIQLGPEPDAVPRARSFVSAVLVSAGFATSTETNSDAKLVVTELVTNALLHARPPVTVRVELLHPGIRIAVADPFRLSPIRPLSNPEAMTGRGIALVDALSRRWGVDPSESGKVVWAELGPSPSTTADQPSPGEDEVDALLANWPDELADTEQRFEVRLGDVPTDLLLSAKTHVDNVVREFTLATSGEQSGVASVIPFDLADLVADVLHDFAEARQEIKRQAVASANAGRERTDLTLLLPASAADAGEAYLEALDSVDQYARAARMLTLESLPQHRAFRHWYIESLVSQLRRAARGEPPGPRQTLEQRLLSEYEAVAAAHQTADRAARLQHVTAALAAANTVEETAAAVVSEGITTLGATGGAVVLLEPSGGLSVAASVGYSARLVQSLSSQVEQADLPAATALREGVPVWLESRVAAQARYPGLVEVESVGALCAVPLTQLRFTRGVLRFSFDAARLFDEDDRRFLEALAAQTSQALDRSYLYAAEREARASAERLAAWLTRLQRVTTELALAENRDRVAEIVVTHLADALGAIQASVALLDDPDTLRLARVRTGDAELVRRWNTHSVSARLPTSQAVRENRPVLVRGRQDYLDRFPDVGTDQVPDGDVAALPLSVGDRMLGVLAMRFPAGELPDEAGELPFLVTLADTCAQALDRADAVERAVVATDKLAFLAEASAALASSLDTGTTLSLLADRMVPRMADWCAVRLLEDEELRVVALSHREPEKAAWAWRMQERYPVALADAHGPGEVIRTGRSLLYREITDEMLGRGAQDQTHLDMMLSLGQRSVLMVPMSGHEGTFGVLSLMFAGSGRRYDASDLSLAEDLAGRAAIAVENARAFQAERGRLAVMTHVAEAAQQAILAPVPPAVGPVRLSAAYVSAAKDALVGGDLYEVVARPGSVRLLIGDVRGKGLAAVRLATVVLGHFRSAAVERDDVADLARQVDVRLAPYLGPEDFVTALIAEIHDDGRCDIVLCGHPPALLVADGRLSEQGTVSTAPLGMGAEPLLCTVQMSPGDRLFLYTDGVLEARTPDRSFVEPSSILGPLHEAPLATALCQVLAKLRSSTGTELHDDVAMLLAEYRPD